MRGWETPRQKSREVGWEVGRLEKERDLCEDVEEIEWRRASDARQASRVAERCVAAVGSFFACCGTHDLVLSFPLPLCQFPQTARHLRPSSSMVRNGVDPASFDDGSSRSGAAPTDDPVHLERACDLL